MKAKEVLEYVVGVTALVAFLALAASNNLSFGILSYYLQNKEQKMKLWIVTNGCAYIVGVFDTEAQARAARLEAEMNGVVGAYVEAVELNRVSVGPEAE